MNTADRYQVLPNLGKYSSSYTQFWNRFQVISRVEDPYLRMFTICKDLKWDGNKVAVKDYAAGEEEQQQAVLENLQSYRKLGEVEGICKLVAFCKNQETSDIAAAFQYNDFSLEELDDNRQFRQDPSKYCRLILKQMLKVMQNAKEIGIQLEELVPATILLYQQHQQYKINILYDERQKNYQKIQEGIKVFCSAEKVQAALGTSQEYDSTDCQQAIFELGLMLLDLLYQYQSQFAEKGEVFIKDRPLLASNLSHKSYLIFHDSTTVQFNTALVNQKIQILTKLDVSTLNSLIELIVKMILPANQRISFEQLKKQSEDLQKAQTKVIQNQQNQPLQQDLSKSVTATHPNRQIAKKDDSIPEQENANSGLIKKHVTSQTTIATANFFPFENKVIDRVVGKEAKIIIPKQKLMTQIKCNQRILQKLQKMIVDLQANARFIKKQYYDNSVYYGQVDALTHKREGFGIYVYVHGDIYFGSWKQNSLIQGTYIFKNGESYEGVVKNGKQGIGRYLYMNGNVYEGEWKDDLKSGKGKMLYPNGDKYEGMWSRGKKNGEGLYFYNNGTVYQGNFVNGNKNGFGVITFPNKTKIEAYWQQTYVEGPGKVFYNNGDYFEGNYHLSQKQGRGLYIWDQTKYEGEFKKDMMEGQARIQFSEKEYYDGRIKNGKREGNGVYCYQNGDEFRGEWKNDQKMMGSYRFSGGASFEGRFKKNEMNYGVMIYENGESYEGEFANGERHGIGCYRSKGGELLWEGKWQRDVFVCKI